MLDHRPICPLFSVANSAEYPCKTWHCGWWAAGRCALAAIAMSAIGQRACRVCGCTEDRGCPEGCHWVERDLCSRCASLVYAGPPKRSGLIT